MDLSPEKPATRLITRIGHRAATVTKLIALVAGVGIAAAVVIAAVVGGLLEAARDLQ